MIFQRLLLLDVVNKASKQYVTQLLVLNLKGGKICLENQLVMQNPLDHKSLTNSIVLRSNFEVGFQ